jgi:hypothetical protein
VRTADAAPIPVDSWDKLLIAAMAAAWTIYLNGDGDEEEGRMRSWAWTTSMPLPAAVKQSKTTSQNGASAECLSNTKWLFVETFYQIVES